MTGRASFPGAASPPGWGSLLTREGQDRLARIREGREQGRTSEQLGAALRVEGVPPEEVSAALGQSDLRRKAAGKFGELAERMLFTPAGLEQATRLPVARLHTERFRTAGCRAVADLGCGIGAESVALALAGLEVRAVERDPLTAAFAEHNLATTPGSDGRFTVVRGDAEHLDLDGIDGVFLDPARRTAGHRDTRRITDPDDYSPSLTFAFDLAERFPTGVKLGPAFDRELIPDRAEAQWVSVDGQAVETGLWFGKAARPGVRRAAALVTTTRGRAEVAELTAEADWPDAETAPLGEYLYEPDAAVIRARLIGRLAEHLDAGMVSDGIAYLTSERLSPTPFARAFRVLEQLPAREKDLRRALASRDIGRLEIKKRGTAVDPAGLRKRLKLRGASSATLFMTRVGGAHTALLAERVD